MPKLLLTDDLRRTLKHPLGELLTGPPQETTAWLRRLVEEEKPPLIICVGDAVSKNVREAGVDAGVSVVDYKVMRQEISPWEYNGTIVFRVSNPAGTIEFAAWEALREAIERKNALLIVDGEEDLLALPAILLAPDGSLVVYGQPREGMVVVKASPEKKKEIQRIIELMTKEDR